MHKPKVGVTQSGPRSALRTVSNYQTASLADPQATPTQESSFAQRAKTESHKKPKQNVLRNLSKSHGDLSKLRPKSPPLCGLRLSPGGVVNDVQTWSTPSNRKSRQALPSDWTVSQTPTRANELSKSVDRPVQSNDRSAGAATSVAITIQGLSPGISGPLDFCKPVVRVYPTTNQGLERSSQGPVVKQIGVTTFWDFSDYAAAQELCRIHQAFTMTLERMLASELWEIYLQECAPNHGRSEGGTSAGVVRGISFCRDQLVGDMADSLYSTQEDIRVRARLGLIRLYLAASDCLVQYDGSPSRDTSITVRLYHDWRPNALYPLVQAAWVPDCIIFKNLDGNQLPREGQEFSLIPQYQCNSAFGCTRFPTRVRYSIESPLTPLSWLTWDDHIAGFRGIVPTYSAMLGGGYCRNLLLPIGSLCIEVLAVMMENNGSSVHFERTVHARLNLDILPRENAPHASPHGCSRFDAMGYDFEPHRPNRTISSDDESVVDSQTLPNMGDHRHSISTIDQKTDPIPSSSKPDIELARWPDVAQKHAHMAGEQACASQRVADADKYSRLFNSIDSHRIAQAHQQQPDLQVYSAGHYDFDPHASQLDMVHRTINGPSSSYFISGYGLDNRAAAHHGSPCHRTTRPLRPAGTLAHETQQFETRDYVRFPTLPPSTIRSLPSQAFGDVTQAWTQLHSPRMTTTHNGNGRRGDNSQASRMLHGDPSAGSPNDSESLNVYRPRSPVEEDRGDLGTAGATEGPATFCPGTTDGAKPVKVDQSSSKRNTRLKLSTISPSKRPKQDGSGNKTPRLGLGVAREISFLGVPDHAGRNMEDTMTAVPLRMPTQDSRPRTDSGYHSDLHDMGCRAQSVRIMADPTRSRQDASKTLTSINLMSAATLDRGDEDQKSSDGQKTPIMPHTSYEAILQGERSDSNHSRRTSSTVSCATSSDLEVIVEVPNENLGRREQAEHWQRPSEIEHNYEKNEPEAADTETRLGEDEKKGIKEAIERSLHDMTENFDEIFINDSDESASAYESSTTDELQFSIDDQS